MIIPSVIRDFILRSNTSGISEVKDTMGPGAVIRHGSEEFSDSALDAFFGSSRYLGGGINLRPHGIESLRGVESVDVRVSGSHAVFVGAPQQFRFDFHLEGERISRLVIQAAEAVPEATPRYVFPTATATSVILDGYATFPHVVPYIAMDIAETGTPMMAGLKAAGFREVAGFHADVYPAVPRWTYSFGSGPKGEAILAIWSDEDLVLRVPLQLGPGWFEVESALDRAVIAIGSFELEPTTSARDRLSSTPQNRIVSALARGGIVGATLTRRRASDVYPLGPGPKPGDRILLTVPMDAGLEPIWSNVELVEDDPRPRSAYGVADSRRYRFRVGHGYDVIRPDGDILSGKGVAWIDAWLRDRDGSVLGYEQVIDH